MKILQALPKIIFLFVILFNVSCSPVFKGKDNEWTTGDITQNREMSEYEQGGHFWCSTRPYGNEEDRINGEKKVRNFIWKHWTEKKRGYIKMTCGQTDTSQTIHYFIELDEKGKWSIARRNIFNNLQNEKTITDDFVTVERAEAKNEEDYWKLIFKAKNGKNLDRLPRL